MSTLDFHGLPLPEGKDKRVLYQSSFRTLATYAMPLADLDSEMRKLLSIRNLTAEADERKDFVGKFCVTTKSESTWRDTIQRKLDAFREQIREKRWKPEDATLDGARENFMKKWRDGRVRADDDSDEDDAELDYFINVVTPWIWCQLVINGQPEGIGS